VVPRLHTSHTPTDQKEEVGKIIRNLFVLSQSIAWLICQLLRWCFTSEMHRPPGLFEHGSERCLILAATHQSVLDPFLIMSALRYRQWRALAPVRTLATQTFRRAPLKWLMPLIRILYRAAGVIELPPKEKGWLRQCALELYDRARRRGAKRP
jgi:1-acyl-sn-glycerol-3-phosphate acyltransferase